MLSSFLFIYIVYDLLGQPLYMNMLFRNDLFYYNIMWLDRNVVVVISQFYVPPASLRGHYGVDIPAFYGGGRPQVPLRAIFMLEGGSG